MDEMYTEWQQEYDEQWELPPMQPYEMLEHKFAYWTGCPNMVVCSSGTAALHLALECLKIPLGSEVLVPDFSFIACARAVTLAGLVPVFVDVNHDDLLINTDLIEQYAEQGSDKLAAVLAVHTYGRRCHMDEVIGIAQKEGLYVVEDLAEAHSVRPHPRTDVSCWSFHKSKVIHGEEGGAFSFRESLTDRGNGKPELAKCLRTLGHSSLGNYTHTPRGHNYRMSNLHAIPILDSLAMVERNVKQRRQIEAFYNEHCPAEWRMPARDCPWTYDIRIPEMTEQVQHKLIETLQRNGIQARFPFKPLRMQEEYHRCRVISSDEHGPCNSLLVSRQIIRLPLDPESPTWQNHKTARECFDLIRSVIFPVQ